MKPESSIQEVAVRYRPALLSKREILLKRRDGHPVRRWLGSGSPHRVEVAALYVKR